MVLLQTVVILLLTCCKVLSPEFLEKTTPFILRSPKLPLPVMAKLMEVTMLTQRLSVRHSIFAQLTVLEVWPSTASYAPTEQSSTRTTSSVIGGSTSTALRLKDSTLSMMNMLLKGLLLMLLPVMPRLTMLPPLLLMLDMLLLLNMKVLKVLAEQGVRDLQAVLTGDKANPLVLTTLIDQNLKTLYLYF